jgi:hypothetical protein
MKKLIFTLCLFASFASPSFAEETQAPQPTATQDIIMNDCQESLTVVALQMAFSEMLGIQLSKEQAENAAASMKANLSSSYGELNTAVKGACELLRAEIKKEVKNKPASSLTQSSVNKVNKK